MNVMVMDQNLELDKKYVDNSYVLEGSYYPLKSEQIRTTQFDEEDCVIESEDETTEEEEELDQKIITQLLLKIVNQPLKFSEIYQEMQGLWLGCGSDPTFRLSSLMDSIFDLYQLQGKNFIEYLKTFTQMTRIIEKHVDRVSSESPSRDIVVQKSYEFCLKHTEVRIHLIFQTLFKSEILLKEDVLKFFDLLKSSYTEQNLKFVELMQPFANWLKSMDEEEESSEASQENEEKSATAK